MPKNIQILDCTLRDGGYVNDWRFGEKGIDFILNKLQEANIDLIEAGFISQKEPTIEGRTIYTSFQQANALPALQGKHGITCMINYGAYDIDDIPPYTDGPIDTLRVAFHGKDLSAALDYCEELLQKGYKTFVQPMATADYTAQELQLLVNRCNQMMPTAVYIVDSFGTMQQKDVLRLLSCYDSQLKPGIIIGFHSHNNLQLSFPNAQEILRHELQHDVIIDSSVFGMGRGAGNLCTELLTMFLNENYHASYQLVPILEIIDTHLNPIFLHTPWGYSMPYYVASINHCHPNYATHLLNKQTLGVREINLILAQIPEDKKHNFDRTLAEALYQQHQDRHIDDAATLQQLQQLFAKRKVLLLAPGKTTATHEPQIRDFIAQHKPIVISINYLPQQYAADMLFLSNTKRFATMDRLCRTDITVVATSNISDHQFMQVDYTSLIQPGKPETDNAGLMLLRLMQRVGLKEVFMAGYDGFSADIHENYCDDQLINSAVTEVFQHRNKDVAEQLSVIRRQLTVHFLTPTRYVQ